MQTFDRLESRVRTYCRSFPAVFDTAEGCRLRAADGSELIDFFSGAGALNYGHNDARMQAKVVEYIQRNGVLHSLDMATVAKREFLERFEAVVLRPRSLEYRIQFPGPTGTNAVEAALKLARKVTGRKNVIFFSHAYHGMTLGALAVTANAQKRAAAGVPLTHAVAMPYDGYLGPGIDGLAVLDAFLSDTHSGVDLPAAVIVETIQAEGGVNVASWDWLRRLAALAASFGVLLIVDDIQVGCGRTGPFFSFEPAGLRPDLVILSKSISGLGLPLSLVLIRPDLDCWQPGEHNGTFRGNNLAFVAGTEALRYWEDDALSRAVAEKGESVRAHLEAIAVRHPELMPNVRGRGLIQGLALAGDLATRVAKRAFANGLVIETVGARDEVLKLIPPLTIDDEGLRAGLEIIERSLDEVLEQEVLPRGTERESPLEVTIG